MYQEKQNWTSILLQQFRCTSRSMMKLGVTIVVLLGLFIVALAMPPPGKCNPFLNQKCSHNKPCPPGYRCVGYKCVCIKPGIPGNVCPPGWINGGPCLNAYGKPRCPYGYQCIRGQCCKQIKYG
ncbi:hypothetical protein ACF0H5_005611 [Mactra antiquata]